MSKLQKGKGLGKFVADFVKRSFIILENKYSLNYYRTYG